MEYLDYVDDNDCVVGVCTREDAGKNGYYVRIAATLVFNSENKIILQKISHLKKKDPLKWSYSAGGHVNSGEDYETAALRELKEELGIDGFIDSYIGLARPINLETGKKTAFHRVFKVFHNGPYQVDHSEAETIQAFSIEEIKQMIRENPNQFKKTLVDIFKIMGIQ